MNPMLITFGQPPTFIDYGNGPCEAINTDRYFRFINTENVPGPARTDQPRLLYDVVPWLSFTEASKDWLGNLIVLRVIMRAA